MVKGGRRRRRHPARVNRAHPGGDEALAVLSRVLLSLACLLLAGAGVFALRRTAEQERITPAG